MKLGKPYGREHETGDESVAGSSLRADGGNGTGAHGAPAGSAESADAVESCDLDRGGTQLGLPDDRILGEISHEMGNYFHKLYYWADYLKSNEAGSGEAGAVEIMESTIERLEHFMRMILEYFAQPKLSFGRVAITDVVGSLGVRLQGRSLVVEGDPDWETTEVMADVGLLGQALRTVFEKVEETYIDEPEFVMSVARSRRGEFDGLEMAFHAGRGASGDAPIIKGIEMAVVEKFLQMHGGEISEQTTGRRSLVVFLPFYQ